MVHYYTATHPNVEENIRLLFEGDINWLVAAKYSWRDPDVRRDPENPYGYFADARIEVFYTGKTLEEFKRIELNDPFSGGKTDILLYCYKRTETCASFAQYNLHRYGNHAGYHFRTACLREAKGYERFKNDYNDDGDFKFIFEYQKDLEFPGMEDFQFPTEFLFHKPEPEVKGTVNEGKSKKKGCIIC